MHNCFLFNVQHKSLCTYSAEDNNADTTMIKIPGLFFLEINSIVYIINTVKDMIMWLFERRHFCNSLVKLFLRHKSGLTNHLPCLQW